MDDFCVFSIKLAKIVDILATQQVANLKINVRATSGQKIGSVTPLVWELWPVKIVKKGYFTFFFYFAWDGSNLGDIPDKFQGYLWAKKWAVTLVALIANLIADFSHFFAILCTFMIIIRYFQGHQEVIFMLLSFFHYLSLSFCNNYYSYLPMSNLFMTNLEKNGLKIEKNSQLCVLLLPNYYRIIIYYN